MVRNEQVAVGCFLNREALIVRFLPNKRISAYKPLSRELLDYVSEANVVAVSDSWVYKRVSLVVGCLSCLSQGRATQRFPNGITIRFQLNS